MLQRSDGFPEMTRWVGASILGLVILLIPSAESSLVDTDGIGASWPSHDKPLNAGLR